MNKFCLSATALILLIGAVIDLGSLSIAAGKPSLYDLRSESQLLGEGKVTIPTLAPDAKSFSFMDKEVVHIRDISDASVIGVYGITHAARNLSWSPDGKKLVLISQVPNQTATRLSIIDTTNRGRETMLPGTFEWAFDDVAWVDDSHVILLPMNSMNGAEVFSLESLKSVPLTKEFEDKLSRRRANSVSKRFRFKKEKQLAIEESDGSYSRIVSRSPNSDSRYFVAPSDEQFFYFEHTGGGQYRSWYHRFVPVSGRPRSFRLEIGNIENSAAGWEKALRSALSGGQKIEATIYKPQVNPLTDKVIGWNGRGEKGTAAVYLEQGKIVAKPIAEGELSQDGDVVGSFNGAELDEAWAILRRN